MWHFCPCDIISSVVAPILATERGCVYVSEIISFLVSVLASVVGYYICKRLCFLIHNQSTLRKKHNKIFMLNIVIPYGSAFLLGTSLATLFIKKILPISIIIGIITLALIYLINYLFLSKFLHFSSNLQQ